MRVSEFLNDFFLRVKFAGQIFDIPCFPFRKLPRGGGIGRAAENFYGFKGKFSVFCSSA